jgi:hypothetical protein
MSEHKIARQDAALSARIVRRLEMTYADGSSDADDRPPHVRAASGLVAFREYLAVIQDDANWLALIDEDDRVHALPLPPGPESGARVFSKRRGNRGEKFDLEACIAVPGRDGPELIGFGSGSHRGREWILRVHESEDMDAVLREPATQAALGIDLKAEFLDAAPFYDALRATREFAGVGLNIEGAVLIDDDTIRLFQRGNASPEGELEPVDATGDVAWRALAAHLADPAGLPPPSLRNIRRYDLGALDGVRLTFSDAEHLGGGRILYSASAEDRQSDAIVGSTLGAIEPDGTARWTEVIDARGGRFEGKIEGLTLDRRHANCARFVIDDDDEDLPSVLFEAELSEAFLRSGRAN